MGIVGDVEVHSVVTKHGLFMKIGAVGVVLLGSFTMPLTDNTTPSSDILDNGARLDIVKAWLGGNVERVWGKIGEGVGDAFP